MNRKFILVSAISILVCIGFFLAGAPFVSAVLGLFCSQTPGKSNRGEFCDSLLHLDYKDSPLAVQNIYQFGVPHTDRVGRPLFNYDRVNSFFPIWMYGMKHPRTAYLCHPDEGAKAWISETIPRTSNIAMLKEAGFNTAQFIGEPDYAGVFLKEVKNFKLQALMYFKPLNRGLELEPGISEFIRANGNHPNILGWIPTEETGHYLSYYQDPKRPKVSDWIGLFSRVREEIRRLSSRPIFIIDDLWLANQTELSDGNNDLKTWRSWNDDSEILALDNYPLNLSKIESFDVSNGLTRAGEFVIRNYQQKKPYWVLLNAYEAEPPPGQAKTSEFPTPKQMRAMVYMSVVSGATGIGYFSMDDYASRKSQMIGIRPDTPLKYLNVGQCAGAYWSDMLQISAEKAEQSRALWNTVSSINFELQRLIPAILSKTSRLKYRVLISRTGISSTPIRTMLKEYDGYYYLIAVNLDRASVKTIFEIPSRSSSPVETLFEKRNLQVRPVSGSLQIQDEFSEFDVHIYRWAM